MQKDVLQTLTACASSYNMTAVSNYSITLWDSLKYEILNVQEEDLAEEALVVLQAIATRLSKDLESTSKSSRLARYIKPITDECNKQLQEPQHKQAKPTGSILSSLATSSHVALYLIVKATIPPLLTLYQAADSIASRKAILEVLVQIFNAVIALDRTLESNPPSNDGQPLEPFKDRLFEIFSRALMSTASEEVSFRTVALDGLLRLCQIRKYLQNSEIGLVIQYLDEIVLTADSGGREDVRTSAIDGLVIMSRLKPNLIMDITFPAFMAKLPDRITENFDAYVITLEGLARVSVEKSISDTLIRRLLNKLDIVVQIEGQTAYIQALLSTIDYVLSVRDLSVDPNLSTYHERIVVALANKAALASVSSGPSMLNEPLTLEILGRLIGKIIRSLDEHRRKSVALNTYTFFLDDEASFKPVLYTDAASEKQRLTMILSTWILASASSAVSEHKKFGTPACS